MDFGKAFTFVFDDPEWIKKIGIAGAIALVSMLLSVIVIGIIGFIPLMGWMIELVRRVINRDPQPLPDWTDFGGFFSKGLQAFVVAIVYALPSIVLSACVNLLPLALQNGGSDETMAAAVAAISLCIGCFSIIYSLFLGIVLPAALGNVAVHGSIGAGFRFGEIIGMVRAAPGAYIMVLLGTIVAQIIAGLGIIACGIGVAFTYAYAMAIQGHLTGQAYNVANQGRGQASVY